MRKITILNIIILIFFISSPAVFSQSNFAQDYSNMIEISNIKTVEASTSHLYVLSELEGMAVFRVYGDSLQWLYTSSGMQRRGDQIDADIRFAYLFGDSKRLTVLEPTSVLGVYSSTLLPEQPLGVARLQNNLFIAMGSGGLGQLSLETPETVDTEANIVGNDVVGRADVLDVISSIVSNQLFVVTSDQQLHSFSLNENELEHLTSIDLDKQIHQLFIDGDLIWGATEAGEVFSIGANGVGRNFGSINESVHSLEHWNNVLFVRGDSGRLWKSLNRGRLSVFKNEVLSGNFIAKSKEAMWLSAFDNLSSVLALDEAVVTNASSSGGEINIVPIKNMTLTFPKPLLIGLELENNYPTTEVSFSYRSSITNAVIQKQGFFWQPTVNQVGYNTFTIIATSSSGEIDSTSFVVDVRTFNSPPRFSPVRSSTLVANDPFELTFNAIDPENPSSELIRYLGVDLPEGATINERTGLFTWTPTARQTGEQTFRVVATDELGAATSQDVTFTVIELSRDGE